MVIVVRFIDLFAGTGAMRIPFDELGYKCVFSSEIDKYARINYKNNFNQEPDGDIRLINLKDIPQHDILLAGFPCQPFSQAGLKKGFLDTRGTLFFDILEIIKYHMPKIILLENVKGFKSHDKGNTFQIIKALLEQEGYSFYSKILNSKDFGLPQNRERIYMIAILNNFSQKEFEFPDYSISSKLGDILENCVDEKYTISDRLWAGHQRRKMEHKNKGNGFGYSLFNADSEYTSTISARYYKDGSEILIEQKDSNPRKLTPREAARLQGFDNNYKITVSDTQAYKQFGNAVSVPVIRALSLEIYKYFKNKWE